MRSGRRADTKPFFPFYVDDWMCAQRTLSMTLSAQGAFVRALCIQWRDGSMPLERSKWEQIFPTLNAADLDEVMSAFPEGRNERLERERDIANNIKRLRQIGAEKTNAQRTLSARSAHADASLPPRNAQAQAQAQKNPPTPRTRGNAPAALVLPASLQTAQDAISRWLAYKAEKGKRYKPTGQAALLKKLEGWGAARTIAALEHSMAAGYDGPYEPKPDVAAGPRAMGGANHSIKYPEWKPDATPRNPNPPKLLDLLKQQKGA
jgi:hypothetical protein